MADDFVWSGASGDDSGDSWENGRPSMMIDWGAEGGFTPGTDFVLVRDSHTETSSSTLTLTGSTAEGTTRAVDVLCVVGADTGTAPGNLSTGAAINTDNTAANLVINESIYINGVDFFSNNDIHLCLTSTDHNVVLENCRLELIGASADKIRTGSTSSGSSLIKLVNVIIDFAATGQTLEFDNIGSFEWNGGSVEFDTVSLFNVPAPGRRGDTIMRGVDFTSFVGGQLVNGIGAQFVSSSRRYTFSRCKLESTTNITDGGNIDVPGFVVEAYNCQSGTDSDPAFQYEKRDARGLVESDVARYRTGGASDGERTNPFSLSIDTSTGSVRGYPGHALESQPITAWTDGDASTAHTYRIYIASGGTLNDDEIWFELEGPNDVATDSLAVFKTTRVAPRTTAAAITTDGASTWNGTDVGTLQQMDITYTPDKPGPIIARVFLAKASDRVSIDPKVYIDP